MTSKRQPETDLAPIIDAAQMMLCGKFDFSVPEDDVSDCGRLGTLMNALGQKFDSQLSLLKDIVDLTNKINRGITVNEILDHVYENFRKYIPFDRIGFSLLEKHGTYVTAHWARSENIEIKLGGGYSLPINETSLGSVLESEHPRIMNDLEGYLRDNPKSESTQLVVEEGIQSSLTCPLISSKPLGFIFFSSKNPQTYEKEHVDIYLQLAADLAAILEKAQLYEQLQRAIELKNRLLGLAVHDLRNPIMYVRGFIQLLQSDVPDGDVELKNKIMNNIDQQCGTMLHLINDLLDISAIDAGRMSINKKNVSLYEIAADVLDTNQLIANDKNISLIAHMPDELPDVYVDKARIVQVFNNLISNAIKFSTPNTQIDIYAFHTENVVKVNIVDHGQGIPEDEISSLFHPFSRLTVKPTAGESSTGLGLTIVKKIIDAHNGSISVTSSCGEGSTFTFTLPIANTHSQSELQDSKYCDK